MPRAFWIPLTPLAKSARTFALARLRLEVICWRAIVANLCCLTDLRRLISETQTGCRMISLSQSSLYAPRPPRMQAVRAAFERATLPPPSSRDASRIAVDRALISFARSACSLLRPGLRSRARLDLGNKLSRQSWAHFLRISLSCWNLSARAGPVRATGGGCGRCF